MKLWLVLDAMYFDFFVSNTCVLEHGKGREKRRKQRGMVIVRNQAPALVEQTRKGQMLNFAGLPLKLDLVSLRNQTLGNQSTLFKYLRE